MGSDMVGIYKSSTTRWSVIRCVSVLSFYLILFLSIVFAFVFILGYNITTDTPTDALFYHRVTEALKFTIGRAMVFGDDSEEFMTPELQQVIRIRISFFSITRNRYHVVYLFKSRGNVSIR